MQRYGGLYVAKVIRGSAAERFGLRAGDILLNMGGQSINTREDYRNAFRRGYLSRQIHVQIIRDRRILQARMEV